MLALAPTRTVQWRIRQAEAPIARVVCNLSVVADLDNSQMPPGVDLDRLATYLDQHAPGLLGGPLRAEVIAGGRSNLTYFITGSDLSDGASTGRERTVVLRRPPLGHVLDTAHDMAREFRIISALADTSVPVAGAIVLCEDPDVLGAPFYLMEKVNGLVLRDFEDAMDIGAASIAPLSYRLVNTLGHLHAIDPNAIGLADFGRPDGFLERQIRRWTKQLDASRSRHVAGIDELAESLASRIPTTQRNTIVHGDYRLDNVIVDRDPFGEYGIAAVVDWEMSTLGDPLTDVGLFCTYWAALGSSSLIPLGPNTDASAPFPPTDDLIASYAEASGLDMTDLPWYIAFGCFKLSVILEGIYFRHSMGKTVGDGFATIGDLVSPLVERGLVQLPR